jgi:hypothetical protein
VTPEELAHRERRASEAIRVAIIVTVAVNLALLASIARQLGMW